MTVVLGRPLSILPRPIPRSSIVLILVAHVLQRDGADERVLGVAVGQKGADGEEDFGDGQRRRPVIFENVQADDALAIDVAVIDSRLEDYLRKETQSDCTADIKKHRTAQEQSFCLKISPAVVIPNAKTLD